MDISVAADRPGADPRVLKALKVGTDRVALTEAVRSGHGTPGNDSPVGPLYGALHLDDVPGYDPETARSLLVDAGFADGLTLTLTTADERAATLAEEWRAQMALVGVTVEIVGIQALQSEGASADVTVTRWLSAPRPSDYFIRRYDYPAGRAEGVWTDEEFSRVLAALADESDPEVRVALYHTTASILADRGPSIVPYYESSLVGAHADLLGVTPAPYWPRTSLRAASFGD
jgi:ABC-type transport system substrate-binding protein